MKAMLKVLLLWIAFFLSVVAAWLGWIQEGHAFSLLSLALAFWIAGRSLIPGNGSNDSKSG